MTRIRTSHDAYNRRRVAGGGVLTVTHLPVHVRATVLFGNEHARQALEEAPAGSTGGTPIRAWIQRQEWLAQCPDCLSAQLVHPEQGLFFCAECGNFTAGGRFRELIFPAELERIEQLLLVRPRVENRNWLPHETPDDLERENTLRIQRDAAA